MQPQQQNPHTHGLDSRCRTGSVINQRRYFFGQKIHTYKTGAGNNQSDPEGRPGFSPDAKNIIQRPRFRDRRHQADRHGRSKDRRQIDQRHCHPCQITKKLRCLTDMETGRLQTLRHDQQIKIGHDRQHQAGHGNRQSQPQQTADNGLRRFSRRQGILLPQIRFQLLLETAIEPHQNQQRAESADASTHTGAAGRISQAVRHKHIGKNDHRHNAHQLFHDLRSRCRRHDLPALQITAEAGQKCNKEHGRGQSNDRIIRTAVTDPVMIYQPLGPEKKRRRKNQPGNKQQPQRNIKDPLGSQKILLCQFFSRND